MMRLLITNDEGETLIDSDTECVIGAYCLGEAVHSFIHADANKHNISATALGAADAAFDKLRDYFFKKQIKD